MNCIISFFELCPNDRIWFILICLLLFIFGYIIGTDGHWNRFYWKNSSYHRITQEEKE